MNQNNVTPSKPINQRMLREMLNLPPSVIRFLKERNTFDFKRVGTEDIFEEESVRQFMKFFSRDLYLTVGECKKKLDRWEFYTFKPNWRKIYVNPLGIYITVKALMRRNSAEIPEEYRLTSIKFGNTEYISRRSFAHTLNWLRKINHRVNPKKPQFNVAFQKKQKKQKKNGLKGLPKINTTKPQTPHPMIIPSMVCPLPTLTH